MPARVLASTLRTAPDMAAFANTTMVRYLDYNDTFVSAGAGHPSDMLPAVLAAGDPCHASGKAVITATVLAYEIYGRFADQVSLGEKGWDQGVFVVIGAACAAGKVLGLDRRRMGHAIALAVVPNVALNQTRVGELSMWKGCATAAAARNGVFAAQLAKEGMEGPSEPFEGRHGLWARATGPLATDRFGGGITPFKLLDTSIKCYPSQIHTQGPIALALDLRNAVSVDDIETMVLETYRTAWASAGSEAEKWDPHTRETADHSLPYVIARAVADGQISPGSFTQDKVRDPGLRALMKKVSIREIPEFTRMYPQAQPCRLEVSTRAGKRSGRSLEYPKGHPKNPLSDAELEDKFRTLAREVLTPEGCQRALDVLWRLEDADDIGDVLELFRVGGP
jgi:2-methylcitrate dehydratase